MHDILITGASGTIGRRLVSSLVAQGHRPTVLLTDPSRAVALGSDADRVLIRIGDYGDPASLDAALHGIRRLFLVSPNSPAQVDQETAVIDAAVRAGVDRIVKVSAHGADPVSPVAFWRWHAAVEEHLRASAVESVALRPTFSMANVLGHAADVRGRGVLFAPEVFTPIAMIDPGDVADVAARLLTTEALEMAPTLELSGPGAVTFDDVASAISRISGRRVSYQAGAPDQVADYLGANGTPPFVVDTILAIFDALRSGAQAQPLPGVAAVLGRSPRPLDSFLATHAGVFRAAS